MFRSVSIAFTALVLLAGCTPPFTSGEPIDSGLEQKPAFLVLDVQRDFMNPAGAFPVDEAQADAAIDVINELLSTLPDSAVVVYARNTFAEDDVANPFRGNSAIVGSEGAELDERLLITDAPVFDKEESDAFSSGSFDAFLRENEITDVYMSGVYADGCVFATGLAAQQRGYDVTIVEDAVANGDDQSLEAAFETHIAYGFSLIESDDVVARFE